MPRVLGVELDPAHARFCRTRFADCPSVSITRKDFLSSSLPRVDAVIGNPPYVPITSLGVEEKERYRREYATARGRFDLYTLFFERSLHLLRDGGRLVFITPEKYVYVESARPLRRLMTSHFVAELQFSDEATFAGRVTYPLITTVEKTRSVKATRVTARDAEKSLVSLHGREESWQPILRGHSEVDSELTLAEVCSRISCGVATGADRVFVHRSVTLPRELVRFAYPTIAGRELSVEGPPRPRHSLLVPYDLRGRLLPESELGALGRYLKSPVRLASLQRRSCVARKPWYAFHETPPLTDMLRPKILCKDIGSRPAFVLDRDGSIVPRHSVYYLVPAPSTDLERLAAYLNSRDAATWLERHCQRAANGFIRLQSAVLKLLPVPRDVLKRERPATARRARSA